MFLTDERIASQEHEFSEENYAVFCHWSRLRINADIVIRAMVASASSLMIWDRSVGVSPVAGSASGLQKTVPDAHVAVPPFADTQAILMKDVWVEVVQTPSVVVVIP